MTLGWLALAFAIVGFAAFTQSTTGFGFALLATPALLLALGPHTTVAVVLVLHTLQCALVLAREWQRLEWVRVAPLLAGGVLGTPLGAAALRNLNSSAAQVAIGLVVAASGAFMLLAAPRPLPAERLGSFVTGFASGLLNSSTGLSGPPVALYLSNQGWSRDRFRSALMATFLVSNLAALSFFLPLGMLGSEALAPAVLLAPAVVGGVLAQHVSRGIAARLDGAAFRTFVGVLIALAGLASTVRGL